MGAAQGCCLQLGREALVVQSHVDLHASRPQHVRVAEAQAQQGGVKVSVHEEQLPACRYAQPCQHAVSDPVPAPTVLMLMDNSGLGALHVPSPAWGERNMNFQGSEAMKIHVLLELKGSPSLGVVVATGGTLNMYGEIQP